MKRVSEVSLKVLETQIVPRLSALQFESATPPADTKRREVCETLIQTLRNRTSREEAKRIGRIWKMLNRVCESWPKDIWDIGKDVLYSLIRATKDGLSCLMECPSAREAMQNTISAILNAIGIERCAMLFDMGRAFGDGMEILKSCVMYPDAQEKVGGVVARILVHIVRNKTNVTGIFHLMRTVLLETFLKHRSVLAAKVDYDALVTSMLFHASMLKQWRTYLGSNETTILVGKETEAAYEKAPSVCALMASLKAIAISVPQTSASLSLFLRGFLDCLADNKASEKWQFLSKRKAGFLFAARMIEISLCGYERESPVVLGAVHDLLVEIDRQQLYEPTLDEGFLQLQFLQRLTGRIFVRTAPQELASPRKKRRKLMHASTETEVDIRLRMVSVLIRIEHRSLTPRLSEVLQFLGEARPVGEVVKMMVCLMEVSGKSRKWTSFISMLLKALPSAPALCTLVETDAVAEAFRKGTENLPTLEVQPFVEMMLDEIRRQNGDLWKAEASECSKAICRWIAELMASIKIPETNAFSAGHCLSAFAPMFEQLENAKDSDRFCAFLKVSRLADEQIERCKNWNPRAEELKSMSCMEIESLIETQFRSAGDKTKEEMAQCLLRRLNWLYHQHLLWIYKGEAALFHERGARTARLLFQLLENTQQEQPAKELRETMWTQYIMPVTAFAHPDQMMRCLEVMLVDFSVNQRFFVALFQHPALLSTASFRDAWKTAFLHYLTRQMSAVFSESIQLSIPEITKTVRRSLKAKLRHLQQKTEAKQTPVCELLDLLEFGLKLPAFLFGPDRLILEASVLWISSISYDPRILSCLSLFLLESLQDHSAEELSYLGPAFFWIRHCSMVICQESVTEYLPNAEAAVFALMKQFIFSQWCHGSLPFFGLSSHRMSKKALWKEKRCTALDLFAELTQRRDKHTAEDHCLQLVHVAVFVRLCIWLCRKHYQPRPSCVKGQNALHWNEKMHKELKKRHMCPDYHEIPTFLQTVVLPYLLATYQHEFEPDEQLWSDLQLGTLSGIVADLSSVMDQAAQNDLRRLAVSLLHRIAQLAFRQSWTEIPVCLDRIGYFLHTLCVWMDTETVKEDVMMRMAQLLLELFTRVIEIDRPAPHPLKQSFVAASFSAEIVCENGSRAGVSQRALLKAFTAVLPYTSPDSLLSEVLKRLELSEQLASKCGTLQFLIVSLHHFRDLLSSSGNKLPGKILESVYRCFWDGYFRHVLLSLVQRKRRKSVHMPSSCELGLFSTVLCGFFRTMALCHSFSVSIPQRITIQIMRRIKRIIQSLHRRSSHTEASVAVPWFGEMCEFAISAVQQQKSVEAARALFSSFRAALEALLSLLIVWKRTSRNSVQPILEKAEVQLGTVYSEMASAPMFAEGRPDLLLSYMRMVDSLKTQKFTKGSPLSMHFKTDISSASISEMELIPRVHQGVLTVYGSLNSAQLKDMEAQIATRQDLMTQLSSFSQENARFRGHAG